jgi:hypothetical protein
LSSFAAGGGPAFVFAVAFAVARPFVCHSAAQRRNLLLPLPLSLPVLFTSPLPTGCPILRAFAKGGKKAIPAWVSMAGMGENRKYFLRMGAIVGGVLVSIPVLELRRSFVEYLFPKKNHEAVDYLRPCSLLP